MAAQEKNLSNTIKNAETFLLMISEGRRQHCEASWRYCYKYDVVCKKS